MGYYHPGNHVHWIQARKATEDHDSWRKVWVFEIAEGLLVVGDDQQGRFGLACLSESVPSRLRERLPLTGRLPAEFSQRWSLLRCNGSKLVSVDGPLPLPLPDAEPAGLDWDELDSWRATAKTGCDSPLRPCACRPDIKTRRPPGPINP